MADKLDWALKELMSAHTGENIQAAVSIECKEEDAEEVEQLVMAVGGELKGIFPRLNGASVYARVLISDLPCIADSELVERICLPLQYSID